ncbi:hypothetical protein SLEP1_g57105 [Rubroshorea leprosula]|uniref:Pentatricopeptide repeat-containing protein n=1 Tax=Rubroshorea leprosula TaxID=152421 RepID=A0AAV5MMN1_9ROSI|nr:hypothetical protein SLEP1_g57105 [Rubroshorea leprosula]
MFMYLEKGCSSMLKVHKSSIPFAFNTNSLLNPNTESQMEKNQTLLEESQVIHRLKDEPHIASALHYFKHIANSNACKHTPETYQFMIKKLAKESELDGVRYHLHQMKLEGLSCSEGLFLSVIESYRTKELSQEALRIFCGIGEFWCKPTVRIYNHVLDALLSENRFKMINPMYQNMKRDGLEPNVFTYNILLKALCKNNEVDAAYEMPVEMSKKGVLLICKEAHAQTSTSWKLEMSLAMLAKMFVRGCGPNIHTFASLIKGYFLAGRVYEALDLWNLITGEGFVPNIVMCNTLIHGFCYNGKISEALTVSYQMEGSGCHPNATTYSSLINGFSKSAIGWSFQRKYRLEEALGLVNEMEAMGMEWNLVTYNTTLSGFSHAGMLAEALQLLGKMLVWGIKPDAITHNTIILPTVIRVNLRLPSNFLIECQQ